MFTVTESAKEYLARKLEEADAPAEVAARFLVADQDLSVELDEPGPEDTTFAHRGRTVAVLNEQVAEHLSGMTLDLLNTEEGPRLALVSKAVMAQRNGRQRP